MKKILDLWLKSSTFPAPVLARLGELVKNVGQTNNPTIQGAYFEQDPTCFFDILSLQCTPLLVCEMHPSFVVDLTFYDETSRAKSIEPNLLDITSLVYFCFLQKAMYNVDRVCKGRWTYPNQILTPLFIFVICSDSIYPIVMR